MNVSFFITVLTEIIAVIIQTEASPRWRWNSNSKHSAWHEHRSEEDDGCSSGKCVQSWKCPADAISKRPTGSCAYWTHGPWVCCILADDGNYNYPKETHRHYPKFTTKVPAVSSEWHPSKTEKYTMKQKPASTTTTNNYWKGKGESGTTTGSLEDTWSGYGRKRPTPISSLGNLPVDEPNPDGSWNKPTNVVNFDAWKKTTNDAWSKRTTTSNPRDSWTPKSKSSISESRIRFPTEKQSWTKKTTKRPISTTTSWKKTTRAFDRKTTAKPWAQPTRVTSRSSWSSNTEIPGRATPRTTRPSVTRQSLSTRATNSVGLGSEERRNQGSGRSTPGYPNRGIITQPGNVYTSSPRITTPRRNIRTTPLPDVNTYYCGIRDQTYSSNQGRGKNTNRDGDVINSGRGLQNSRGRQSFQRIVGGEEVEPFTWPWVAALYKVSASGVNRFLSAGSLINENFVLTAAHPFTRDDIRSSSYIAMLGTHNAEDAFVQYLVSSVLQHPQYEQRFYYHDIALLRLERPVTFNNYVMPVCLPSPNAPFLRDTDLEGKSVTVMGWGDESYGGKTSRVLKEASFAIVSRRTCNDSYVRVASNRFPRGITEDMLCAGDPNGGKDACQGDSGGPLTSVVRGRYTQVGIVSFGYQCGDKEFPGVYTKVASYLSWIAENTARVRDYNYDYN